MWNFIVENYEWIILIAVAGLAWWGKIKMKNVEAVATEANDFVKKLKKALEDNKLTADELTELIKEAKDIFDAAVGKKEPE